jgi:hypothetical protein
LDSPHSTTDEIGQEHVAAEADDNDGDVVDGGLDAFISTFVQCSLTYSALESISDSVTMSPKRMATVRMDDDPSVRRSFISPDRLLTRPDGDLITTVSDIFPYAVSSEYTRRSVFVN